LHVIAWAAVAVVVALHGAIFAFRWVGGGIWEIVLFFTQFIRPVALLLGIVAIALLTYFFRVQILSFLVWVARLLEKYLVPVLTFLGVVAVLFFVTPILYRWIIKPVFGFLAWLLSPVVQVVLFVLKWILIIISSALFLIFIALMFVLSCMLIGMLLVIQLQSGWHAARNVQQMLLAGFSIGSALALITLVCVAPPTLAQSIDQSWLNVFSFVGLTSSHSTSHLVTDTFRLFLPDSVGNFVFTYLTNLEAPALDSFFFLAVLGLATLSVLCRVFSATPVEDEHVPLQFIVVEYVKMVLGLFVLLVFIFAQAATGSSHAG
jgi:hypothetical protein